MVVRGEQREQQARGRRISPCEAAGEEGVLEGKVIVVREWPWRCKAKRTGISL